MAAPRPPPKGGMKGAFAALKGAGKPPAPQGGKGGVSALKRPSPGGIIQPTTKALRIQAPGTIVVYSAAEKEELGIRTLVGEYREEGTNHDRKYYRKTQKIKGHEDVDVYLYFWDARDGPSFKGWWFGNSVGGAQVWSRNTDAGPVPPKSGWTIPWDGPVQNDLVVATAADKEAADKRQAASHMELRRGQENAAFSKALAEEWEERVQKATEKAAEVEIGVSEALEQAKQVMEGDIDDELVLETQKELAAQAQALAETQRAIATEGLAAQKAPPDLKAELVALGTRLRTLQATIKEVMGDLKNVKVTKMQRAQEELLREEEDSRLREQENLHSKQLEEMLPAAMEKTDAADDEVEKVAIASAPLQVDTAEDLRSVMMEAIKETEQRVRAAQAAIGEARRFISAKLSQVGRFTPSVKKTAVDEFTALQEKLSAAQQKLDPYKTVRQDYEQRVQAKKLQEELSSKLAGAEVEVEKAAMMVAPMGGDSLEGMKETEQALQAAQSALAQTSRLIESKLKTVDKTPGPLQDEIKALKERCQQAQEKLDEVRKTVKDTQIRIAADNLLREVSEKVSNAEDELQVMAEQELPFLRGEQQGKDLDAMIAEADQVATKVHTALAEAQTFVAKKMVEVARFSEGPAKSVREEIALLQKRLEDGRERLQQFRASTADRKRQHLLEDVEQKVTSAESEVQKMLEATQALGSIGAPGESVAEGAQEAVEQASLAERAAQASIVAARKHLLQRTAELKKLALVGAGSGGELGRLQTRVNAMQQDIAKLRNATKDAEERLRVKQLLAEVVMRMQTTEGEVDKVAAGVVPVGDEAPSAEKVERMDKAVSSAKMKLTTTAKLVDVKLKTAQGVLKEELTAMRAKITAAEKKLAKVAAAAKEQRERLESASLLSEALAKVEQGDLAVKKASEAELPFLKGVELSATEATQAITECEAASQEAQKAIMEGRTFVVQKLVDAKALSDNVAEACTKELLSYQKKLDAHAQRLGELKKDTAQRKLKAQMQASGEKISSVEAAVQKLADTMAKFSDDKVSTMAPEEACAMCEEVAGVEEEAQAAVTDARKFLSHRVQEAKSMTESQRGPITSAIAKLQSRLTQCQVELAKLSKQCTEREQRFVAQTLVQNATAGLKELQDAVERASKVAAPLLADDKSEFIKASSVQMVVQALHGHRKSAGLDAASIFAGIGNGKSASRAELVAFLEKLPELAGKEEAALGEAGWGAVFAAAAGKDGKVSVASFEQLMRDRAICVSSTPVADKVDGKEVGGLEVGEGVEVLDRAVAQDGKKHARCLLVRDGSSAWVPESSLRPSPPFAGRVESIEAHVGGVLAKCAEAGKACDQKAVEVASAKQGPLAEVKSKLLQIRSKITHEQSQVDTLKRRAVTAKAAVLQERKEQVAKVQEARCKAFAEKSVAECTEAVAAAEAIAAKAAESAKAIGSEKSAGIAQLEAVKSEADQALKVLAEATAAVARNLKAHEAFKGASRNMLLEARVELTKLNSRVSGSERKLGAATEAIMAQYTQVAKAATMKARKALRAAARKSGKSVDQLFDQVAKGAAVISQAAFGAFVKSLPGQGLTQDQVALVFREFGPEGLSKSGFAKALQEFCKCEREIAITDAFSMEGAAVVRKLDQGELFEVLEGPEECTETQVMRVRGRAIRDGTCGWVTLKGNQGTPFLKPREKPFLQAVGEGALHAEFSASSAKVRQLVKDEVLELLEGPRELVETQAVLHARVSTDGTEGFFTFRDAAGVCSATPSSSLYVCRSTIAMTDVFEIETCKVVRKVDVGEALEVVEAAAERVDEEKAVARLKFRALRDGKEGWVTLKGNHGTAYVEDPGSCAAGGRRHGRHGGAAIEGGRGCRGTRRAAGGGAEGQDGWCSRESLGGWQERLVGVQPRPRGAGEALVRPQGRSGGGRLGAPRRRLSRLHEV